MNGVATNTVAVAPPIPAETTTFSSHNSRMAFSVKETADLLGLSEKTIRRLISRKLLRPSRALRHHLISRKEIDRFLEETSAQ